MERHLAIGANWNGPLLARLTDALVGWKITAGVAAEYDKARAASVLVPFGMPVGRDLLADSRIRLIQQFGVGLDNVDLAAAHELGIPVCNAPSAISGMAASVAEGAVLLVLSCARLPSLRSANLTAGRWNWTMPLNLGLAGKTVGLVGLGSIGKAIAQRLAAFDMRLVAVRRSAAKKDVAAIGLDWVGGMDRIDDLVRTSDFIVICAPLTSETRDLFDETLIRRTKVGASIINVGRGAIVNEAALIASLDVGALHAAGLDTVHTEPPPQDSPLLVHPRVVLTPHDAGVSDVAFDGVARIVAGNLDRLESGAPLQYRVV